jgi:hypothetical protein
MKSSSSGTPKKLPKTIRLRMEQCDIDTAICNSRQHCAIAQTIYRQLNIPIGRVRVTAAGVSIAQGNHRHHYQHPESAARVVRDMDAHKPVKPIPFSLHRSHIRPITPVDDARKNQINKARREKIASLTALGLKPKTYSKGRYAL